MAQHGNEKLTLKFSILQFTLWTTWCSFFSFAAMYFVDSGYGYSFVGVALSVAIGCGIAGQVFWGFLCDKIQSIKKVYILVNILLLLAILTLYRPVSPIHILISIGFFGFCQTPLPAILDSWILKKHVANSLDYGFIRMWAALGFSLFGWIVGINIEKAGYWVMFVYAGFFITCTTVVSLLTADAEGSDQGIKLKDMGPGYMKLLKNKKYLLFLAACLMIGLGNQASGNLRAMVVTEVGGNSDSLGMIIFLAAITELPFFFFSSKIFSRFTAKQCFVFSCCAYMIHFIIVALAKSIAAVAFGMMFHGIGFSVLLPNLRAFAYNNVPEELRTSGLTLTDALFAGLAGVISSAFGAIIIENTSVAVLYSIFVAFVIFALVIFLKVTRGDGADSHADVQSKIHQ